MNERIEGIIQEYRKRVIEGSFIDLIPFSEKDIENVVEIRNREENRYFLNQTYALTVDGQFQWYRKYLERDNDIYWCIYSKKEQFIGTIRIYDIDEEKDLCNQGSFMIDKNYSEGAPYALEAEILSLDFAFNVLEIGNVINENRVGNKVMNNLTRQLGFELKKNTVINGCDYKYYLLSPIEYSKNRNKFMDVMQYWTNRG